MPRIRRTMPPWHPPAPDGRDHSIAGQLITFDDHDEADVVDADVLALMHEFPETFTVVEEAPAPAPASPGAFSEADLEPLTVADLQELATGMNILGIRHMRKSDLIESILAHQRIVGGR